MGIRTVTLVTCDHCNRTVEEGEIWIDYTYHGVAFHWDCLVSMSAIDFVHAVLESGDQMFVKDTIKESDYSVELKHLDWSVEAANNMKNIVAAYRMSH